MIRRVKRGDGGSARRRTHRAQRSGGRRPSAHRAVTMQGQAVAGRGTAARPGRLTARADLTSGSPIARPVPVCHSLTVPSSPALARIGGWPGSRPGSTQMPGRGPVPGDDRARGSPVASQNRTVPSLPALARTGPGLARRRPARTRRERRQRPVLTGPAGQAGSGVPEPHRPVLSGTGQDRRPARCRAGHSAQAPDGPGVRGDDQAAGCPVAGSQSRIVPSSPALTRTGGWPGAAPGITHTLKTPPACAVMGGPAG